MLLNFTKCLLDIFANGIGVIKKAARVVRLCENYSVIELRSEWDRLQLIFRISVRCAVEQHEAGSIHIEVVCGVPD